MSAAGVCTLCGLNRSSRLCKCLDRVKSADDFHPLFADILKEMRDIRFFAKGDYERFAMEIQSVRASFTADYVGDNRRHLDGFDLIRLDKQSERLIEILRGKRLASLSHSHRSSSTKTSIAPRVQSVADLTGDAIDALFA